MKSQLQEKSQEPALDNSLPDADSLESSALSHIQNVLDSFGELPSPPAIAVRILDAVKDDKECFRSLAQVISSDPALTAKMLKVANSSIYGVPRRVDTIEMALTVLGIRALKNIALSFVIAGEIQNACSGAFDFKKFWKGAVTSAVAAEMYSSLLGEKNDDTFVSALLQDIGYLVMFLTRPEDYIRVMSQGKGSELNRIEYEREIFGFDHQELGAAMLKDWGLPETIYMPILYHHISEQCPDGYQDRAFVLFASHLLSSVYQNHNSGEKAQQVHNLLKGKKQLAADEVEKLIDSVAENTTEIFSTFELGNEKIKPYSQLLQEANQELGKLNLSYEQLILDLKGAKDEAENLATQLMDANQTLNSLAFNDSLTGSYNHRYFLDMLANELERSLRYSCHLSLMFFDVDHFKNINDSYGHLAGDFLLKTLVNRVAKIIRNSDILARFGGDEFAVIMPETNPSGLKVFSERVRRGIEQMAVGVEGHTVNVTVSIGGTTVNPGVSVGDPRLLIQAADQAVYQSKERGRNKFTFLPFEEVC